VAPQDSVYTKLIFIHENLPPFNSGATISVWNHERAYSVAGNKGLIIDLKGPGQMQSLSLFSAIFFWPSGQCKIKMFC